MHVLTEHSTLTSISDRSEMKRDSYIYGTRRDLPASDRDAAEEEAALVGLKPYGSTKALAMCMNYIIGTGCFGLPIAFVQAGLGLTTILILCGCGLSLISMNYTLEFMARANGVTKSREAGMVATAEAGVPLATPWPQHHLGYRKFDFAKIAGLFSGMRGRLLCQGIIAVYGIGTLWGFASMAGSSAASLFFDYSGLGNCNPYSGAPGLRCTVGYYVSLGMFGCIVVSLALKNLSSQAHIQTTLSVYRAFAFLLMLSTLLLKVSSEIGTGEVGHRFKAVGGFHFSKFAKGFGPSILALNCHYNMPDALQPLSYDEKENARLITFSALLISLSIYIALGVLGALAFDQVNPLVTLNWKHFTGCGDGWSPCISGNVSYFGLIVRLVIQLFPIVNVISAYPMIAISIADNISVHPSDSAQLSVSNRVSPSSPSIHMTALVPAIHTSQVQYRLLTAIPPLLLAGLFRQLDDILSAAGLLGFILVLTVPAYLQLISKKVCENEWGSEAGETEFSVWCIGNNTVTTFMLCISWVIFGTGVAALAFG